MERIDNRSGSPAVGRLLSAIMTYLPRAWFSPSREELTVLYRLRYCMALEEAKFDAALVFLDKILEIDPGNLEAKLLKGELYHRHLNDFGHALEQYNKVLRLAPKDHACHSRARNSLSELMELVS